MAMTFIMTIIMIMMILTGVLFPLFEIVNHMTKVADKGFVKIWTPVFLFQEGMLKKRQFLMRAICVLL